MPKTTRPTPEETQRGYPFAVGGFVNVLRENDIKEASDSPEIPIAAVFTFLIMT